MTEKFESSFHRRYVGGQGEIVEKKVEVKKGPEVVVIDTDTILEQYRWYVGDPTAKLPSEVVEHLKLLGKI